MLAGESGAAYGWHLSDWLARMPELPVSTYHNQVFAKGQEIQEDE